MSMQDSFADQLKQMRKERHASLDRFAEELGIAKSTLQKYEAGKGNATLATVEMVAQKTGKSPKELLGLSEEDMVKASLLTLKLMDWFAALPVGSRTDLSTLVDELGKLLKSIND